MQDKNKSKNLIILLNIFIEISLIPKKINDNMIGLIRLSWWREELTDNLSNSQHNLLTDKNLIEDNLTNILNIIDAITIELDDEIKSKTEEYIDKKYNSLILMIANITNEKYIKSANLGWCFFIIIDMIIKRNFDIYNSIYNNIEIENIIETTEKHITNSRNNLLAIGIKHYISIIKKNKYDIENIYSNKYNFGLIIKLYCFKIKSIFSKIITY